MHQLPLKEKAIVIANSKKEGRKAGAKLSRYGGKIHET